MSDSKAFDRPSPNIKSPASARLRKLLVEQLGEDETRTLLRMHSDANALNDWIGVYQNRNRLIRAIFLASQQVGAASQPTAAKIPRNIIQFWDAPTPPVDVLRIIRSWIEKNPDYTHTLFDDRTAAAFIDAEYGPDARQLFEICPHPVLRSDLFRFFYLYRKGGIYIDADEECLKPLGQAFGVGRELIVAARVWEFAAKREVPPRAALDSATGTDVCGFYVNNAPLGCVPGLPLFEAILAHAIRAVRAALAVKRAPEVEGTTDPKIFTSALIRWILEATDPLSRITTIAWEIDWYGGQAAERRLSYHKTSANWHAQKQQINTAPANPLYARQSSPASDSPNKRSDQRRDITASSSSVARSGSTDTAEYRLLVERFIALNNIRRVLDIGCGDWQFSRFINFAPAAYLGLDVVPELVETNRKRFGSDHVAFEQMPEKMGDVPAADLILIKDVLQHLPNAVIEEFRREVLPKCRFALVTNSFVKGNTPRNTEIEMGGFRCLDLTAAPYRLPGAYVLDIQGSGERLRTLLVEGGMTV